MVGCLQNRIDAGVLVTVILIWLLSVLGGSLLHEWNRLLVRCGIGVIDRV